MAGMGVVLEVGANYLFEGGKPSQKLILMDDFTGLGGYGYGMGGGKFQLYR
jgi:hypothetical protein